MGRKIWSVHGVAIAIVCVLTFPPVLPLLAFPPYLPHLPYQPIPQRDSSATPQTGTAIIRGRVTLAGSGQPVARADVRASSPTLKTARAVKTDTNGRYEIKDLPAGKYVVSVVKPNFVTASFGQKRPLGPGVPFDLADGQIAANVNFSLAHSGVISGRVIDEFGDPAADVQVATMRYVYVNGDRRLMPASGRGSTTNDIGEFRLFGLPPDDYFVSARMQNMTFSDSDDRSESRAGYAPTYYPGTANVAEAQRISIGAGQVVSGISLTLTPVRTVRISGVALDASGQPMSGTRVMMISPNGAFGIDGSAMARADGRFSLGGLTPGDYVLRAGGDMSGGDAQIAILPITVGDSDITDVQLIAYRQSTVTGRVVFDSQDAPPTPSTVRIAAARPNPAVSGGGNTTVKDDLTFDIKTPPGHSLIRVNVPGPGRWQLKSVMLNGMDVIDTGIDIPPNTTIPNLVVTMTTQHGELSGTVAGANGEAERDCWVIVFPQDSARWTPLARGIAVARPAQTNRFQLSIPPGTYYAVAVDTFDVEAGEWTDAAFLARVRDRAVTFSIADGDKKSLDLKVSSSR
jgi:hypothetical protein